MIKMRTRSVLVSLLILRGDSHPFLKLLSAEISENRNFLADASAMANQLAVNRRVPLSSDPETDQQNQDKRGQNEPWDRDDFDPHFANGRNIVVDVRVAVKKSGAIAKVVCASRKVREEEEGGGDCRSRKRGGVRRAGLLL